MDSIPCQIQIETKGGGGGGGGVVRNPAEKKGTLCKSCLLLLKYKINTNKKQTNKNKSETFDLGISNVPVSSKVMIQDTTFIPPKFLCIHCKSLQYL